MKERKMIEKKMIADTKRTKWRYSTEELAAISTNNIKQVNKMKTKWNENIRFKREIERIFFIRCVGCIQRAIDAADCND